MIIDEIREKIKFQKNILIVGNDSGKLKEIYDKVLKMIKEEIVCAHNILKHFYL